MQEPAVLTKPLRSSLKEWNFEINKKERKGNTHLVTSILTIDKASTTPADYSTKDSQLDYHVDYEQQEDLIQSTTTFQPSDNQQNDLSIFQLLADVQNSKTNKNHI